MKRTVLAAVVAVAAIAAAPALGAATHDFEIEVLSGAPDQGGGVLTVAKRVTAATLSVDLDRVSVRFGNTEEARKTLSEIVDGAVQNGQWDPEKADALRIFARADKAAAEKAAPAK